MESQPKQSAKGGGCASKRNRGLLSCTECHRRKQKCNRRLPCNDCTQRGVPQKCAYKPLVRLKRIINGSEVLLTPESVVALQFMPQASTEVELMFDELIMQYDMDQLMHGLFRAPPTFYPTAAQILSPQTSGVNPWFLGGLDPFSSTPTIIESPIPTEWLISHFIRVLAPWLSSYDDSLTPISPRVSWFAYALNHMPLFYATLLSAAVHLDRMKSFGDLSKLLWYKAETLRLTNEKIQDPSEAASDQMILVALILLFFNVTGNNGKEYDIHLRGIDQMLKVRGGVHKTGMNGMVRNWIAICHGPWDEDWQYGQFPG